VYKLCFYVPETHLKAVKSALFEIGAGKIGDYDCCCWQALGQGQFRPLSGSAPFIGQQGKIEVVAEYKVEMVFESALLSEVVTVLKKAHPYEEPAFDIVAVINPKH
jgi:hypothetical protein